MAINIADQFGYFSKKPLDSRTQYATLADMKAVTDANIPEGCEAYCVATDKYYKFLSSNTVDSTTGKWRERESGGSSTLTDLTDTTISSPSNGQVLAYDSATSKWKNSNASGGASSLNELSDVTISSASNGQVLKHNGTSWVNGSVPSDNAKQPKTLDTPISVNGVSKTTVEDALGALASTNVPNMDTYEMYWDGNLHTSFMNFLDRNPEHKGLMTFSKYSSGQPTHQGDCPEPITMSEMVRCLLLTTYTSTSYRTGYIICYMNQHSYIHEFVYNKTSATPTFTDLTTGWVRLDNYAIDTVTSGSAEALSSGGAYNAFTTTNTTIKDSTPTSSSQKPITSGGVFSAFTATNSDLKDYTPTSGSQKPFTSGGAYTALSTKYDTSDVAETDLQDNDSIPFFDRSANLQKKTLWSNIKSVLKTYFDTVYTFTNATELAKIGEQSGVPTYDGQIISLPTVHNFDKANLYSTTEQVVGKWTDGRPVYSKTVSASSINIPTNRVYSLGITGVSTLVKASGTLKSGTTSWAVPYNMTTIGASSTDCADVFNDNGTITLHLGNGYPTGSTAYTVNITVLYTKTSDAANSFNYASENDYSTSETIVGTWLNGEKIYQKTIQTTSQASGGTKTIATLTSGSKILHAFGYVETPSARVIIPYCTITTTQATDLAVIMQSGNNINLIMGTSWQSGWSVIVTIQYTKS